MIITRKMRSLARRTYNSIYELGGVLFPRTRMRSLAKKVYNYHNLGAGVFPNGEEKTPFGSGERYNFDRMYMMVSSYDFTRKNIVDLGCNSGWFCVQAKLLGTNVTIGIDQAGRGMMGAGFRYAAQFERCFKLGIQFLDKDLERTNFLELAARYGIERFDAALLLSVFHHIGEQDDTIKSRFMTHLYESVKDVIFYEDHEFWNDFVDGQGNKIPVKGEGYRFGWNEDMSWQRRMSSLESHETKVLNHYRTTWRKDVLMLDRFAEVRLLGFSEKRRPLLGLFKRQPAESEVGSSK